MEKGFRGGAIPPRERYIWLGNARNNCADTLLEMPFIHNGFRQITIDLGKMPMITTPEFIKRVIHNENATIVIFGNNKKIVVRKSKEDKGDVYSAVAYAIAEYIFASNSHFKKVVDRKLQKCEKAKK